MMERLHALPKSIARMVAAAILLTLCVAMLTPSPQVDPATGEAFTTMLVLQKKFSDDSSEPDSPDHSFASDVALNDALEAIIVVYAVIALLRRTQRHFSAAHLANYINPPLRAPPSVLFA